jgi:hypothetical protein
LWVLESGELIEKDPHVSNAYVYPVGKVPVGRVISPTSIFFDQGLGAKGDTGNPGTAIAELASPVVIGITKLSVYPQDADNPIAVGINDPILANKVNRTGDTMTGPLIQAADPVVPLGTATKQYVDSKAPKFDRILATASQTIVTTLIPVKASAFPMLHILVFRNGVLQQEGTGMSFTVTGPTQLTFANPLTANDNITIISYGG